MFEITPKQYPDISTRWLLEETDNIQGLIEIIANELVEYLDFSRLEIDKTSYITDILKTLESDLVFTVPFREEVSSDELVIYILIEHQSTVDPMMPFRILNYMCQIWDNQRRKLEASDVPKSKWRLRPILPIVFYTGAQQWKTPIDLSVIMDVPDLLERFVPKFDTLFLGVKETDPSDLTKSENPFGWLLKVLQDEQADEETLRRSLGEVLVHIESLDTLSANHRKKLIVYLYQLIFFRRPKVERNDLYAFIETHTRQEEITEMVLTSAEALYQQGIEQGKIDGIEQGKMEGIEQGKMEGIEQGAKENAIDSILLVLDTRFQLDDGQTLQSTLESINDIQRLRQLLRLATEVDTLDTFINTTDTSGEG